jgi:hypothetical protein
VQTSLLRPAQPHPRTLVPYGFRVGRRPAWMSVIHRCSLSPPSFQNCWHRRR